MFLKISMRVVPLSSLIVFGVYQAMPFGSLRFDHEDILSNFSICTYTKMKTLSYFLIQNNAKSVAVPLKNLVDG